MLHCSGVSGVLCQLITTRFIANAFSQERKLFSKDPISNMPAHPPTKVAHSMTPQSSFQYPGMTAPTTLSLQNQPGVSHTSQPSQIGCLASPYVGAPYHSFNYNAIQTPMARKKPSKHNNTSNIPGASGPNVHRMGFGNILNNGSN